MRIAALGSLGRIGIGSLTQDQVDQANGMLERLQQALSRPTQIVDDARRTGLDDAFTQAIASTRGALFGRLQELSEQIPSLSAQNLDIWLSRARGLESDISRFEQQLTGQLPAERRSRTFRTVGLTIAGVAGVSFVLWAAYRASKTWWVR